MKNYEGFLRARGRVKELEGKIPNLRNELTYVEGKRESLSQAAAKAKALKSPGWEKSAQAFDDNERRMWELRDEIERGEIELGATKTTQDELRGPALEELRAKWRPTFEKAVQEFAAQLKKAAEFESKAQAIRLAAEGEVNAISDFPASAVPNVSFILIAGSGTEDNFPIARWLRDVKAQLGIDLG
jgi:chromosome segregation ATPase